MNLSHCCYTLCALTKRSSFRATYPYGIADSVIFQSIKAMTEFFGPLESFKSYQPSDKAHGNLLHEIEAPELLPPPHNASRSSGMSNECWEVKWQQREDCITALLVSHSETILSDVLIWNV
jgi:hypothetical protein